MHRAKLLLTVALGLSGCASVRSVAYPDRSADVVTTNESGRSKGRGVPPGHYPPPGQCRLWYDNRPPGHQPPATRCEQLVGHVPYGAVLLYNNRSWDTRHDWNREESRRRGSVPGVVLRIMNSVTR